MEQHLAYQPQLDIFNSAYILQVDDREYICIWNIRPSHFEPQLNDICATGYIPITHYFSVSAR
jgi:hypothetical protein